MNWLLGLYLAITLTIFISGLLRYDLAASTPSATNRMPARKMLLCWAWPGYVFYRACLWWLDAFERVWIDAQWSTPAWLTEAQAKFADQTSRKEHHVSEQH